MKLQKQNLKQQPLLLADSGDQMPGLAVLMELSEPESVMLEVQLRIQHIITSVLMLRQYRLILTQQ